MNNPEVGRELRADELVTHTVVVLVKEHRPAATMWVDEVDVDYVLFYAGEIGMLFFCKRLADGTLEDDTPARIRVFEYLGEM